MKNRYIKSDIELLATKLENGEISPQEYDELLRWYNSFDDSKVSIEGVENTIIDDIKTRMYARIQTRINNTPPVSTRVKQFNHWKWAVAAVALIFITFGLLLFHREATIDVANPIDAAVEQITPGSNRASLILADGTSIELNELEGGVIIDQEISYVNGERVLEGDMGKVSSQLKLQTPRGGTYKITLADGTEVWLNSGSSLSYPATFTAGVPRQVQLQGEAYFKVRQLTDHRGVKVPFVVETERQKIEVLGTSFNVSDYEEYNYTHTTLVEGRVAVHKGGNNYPLLPNQQFIARHTQVEVKSVNPGNFTAWTEGKFDFSNKPLRVVLDEIANWYDIDVIYQGRIPEVELTGEAYRNSDFKLILRLLEVAKIDYDLDVKQRKLTIK